YDLKRRLFQRLIPPLLRDQSIVVNAGRNAGAFLNFEVARSGVVVLNLYLPECKVAPAKLRRDCPFLCPLSFGQTKESGNKNFALSPKSRTKRTTICGK